MSNTLLLILSGFVIMVTNAIEGVTGFGSTVIALPFLNLTVGLHDAVQMLCFFGWLVPLYIVSRSWKHIKWNELGRILLYCAPGVPIGMVLFDILPAEILCAILGLFMIYVSISGCQSLKCRTCMPVPMVAKRSKLLKFFLFCGGVIQGAFGTGGPFIVIYATKALPDNVEFAVAYNKFNSHGGVGNKRRVEQSPYLEDDTYMCSVLAGWNTYRRLPAPPCKRARIQVRSIHFAGSVRCCDAG